MQVIAVRPRGETKTPFRGGIISQRIPKSRDMLQVQTIEVTPVKTLRWTSVLTVAFVLLATDSARAQGEPAPSQTAGCWNCRRVVLPYGLYIREVTDGGSFVTLEDGSVWEIRLPQRPVASSWRPGDFVELKTILAPVDRFEILLAHGDRDLAEARLAGRRSENPNVQQ